ncbi:integrase catalytic domain-containing protein, partial [Trichonephila clavipes]
SKFIIEQIPDILDRFRRYPIGLSADIEKAFLQLGITPKHRDFLRFFYPDEGEEIVYRHCRVVFGVSSSPFLLAAVLAHLLENVPADDTQLGSKLKLSFYVDNCVTGVNDIAQEEEFILRSKEILSRGCFNLSNWESNVESGRRTVRKIWNACVKCRKFKSKSPMTDPVSLPSDRVKDTAVFEVVGVDLAGPPYVKQGDKVWIVLYTCAIYRALHLELVSSLSTDAFLLSFRRFVARRGRPRIIYSDNGTNFRSAYNELVDIDWNEVSRYAEIQRITWKFIPPTLVWWGGFWERLVRTVKELLRRTLGKAIFTYAGSNSNYAARFLFEIPTADTKDLDVRDANPFRKRLKFRAKVIEELKRRFRNEYLGQLIQRQKQHPQSSNIQGKDGLVTTIKLKTQSSTLILPIQHVFPLEVSGNDITNPPLQKVQQIDSSVSCPNPDTLKATEQPQVTRCGRSVKKPDKLNLLTLTDVFD